MIEGLTIGGLLIVTGGMGFGAVIIAANVLTRELAAFCGMAGGCPSADDHASDDDAQCPFHGVLGAAETITAPSRKSAAPTGGVQHG